MTRDKPLKRVLVTGATGRVGRMVRAAWANMDAETLGITPIFLGRRKENDLRWPADLWRSMPQCDAVIAMWGQTGTDPEKLAENLSLARSSRDLARACGAERVFHFSSSAVYGAGRGWSETDTPQPGNIYARYKLMMEEMIASFDDGAVNHCCLRLANVVGADSLADILRGHQFARLDQFEDGTGPIRSYIGARDLAKSLAALVNLPLSDLPSVLNLAAPEPLAMVDLVRASKTPFKWQPAPKTAVKEVSVSTKLLSSLLPEVHFETDPSTLLRHFRALDQQAA